MVIKLQKFKRWIKRTLVMVEYVRCWIVGVWSGGRKTLLYNLKNGIVIRNKNFSQPHGNLIVWETWKFHKNLNQELHKYQLKSSTLFVKGSIYEERMSG